MTVPHGTLRVCWGCLDPISDSSSSDHCEVCQVSRLVRRCGVQSQLANLLHHSPSSCLYSSKELQYSFELSQYSRESSKMQNHAGFCFVKMNRF